MLDLTKPTKFEYRELQKLRDIALYLQSLDNTDPERHETIDDLLNQISEIVDDLFHIHDRNTIKLKLSGQ